MKKNIFKKGGHRLAGIPRIAWGEGGFTLIELLTVTFIILIISVLVVANYHRGNRSVALSAQAARFAQDLRRAQESALSLRQINGMLPYGYGIYVRQGGSSYILYSDNNNDKIYNDGEAQETVALDGNIEISSCLPNTASIDYIAPDLTAKINNGAGTELRVVFRVKNDASMTRSVVANIAGLVYVQ
jgi:prepilin-type N-terminal cleavage/methylation domain-containing protein